MVYIQKVIICLSLLFRCFLSCQERVEMSFLAADVKFSFSYGIKVCEIQAGSLSGFSGFDIASSQKGMFAKTFCNTLESYQKRVWFVSEKLCDANLKKEFLNRGWRSFHKIDDLINDPSFQEAIKMPFRNPLEPSSYQGIVYTSKLKPEFIEEFKRRFPNIILMDAVTMPYFGDKLLMSRFFEKPPLNTYKPRWNFYPKRYDEKLADRILNDIQSEIVVIKPRKGSLGNGVIIVHKDDLDETLKMIFAGKMPLRNNPDKSFSFWAYDKADSFIVEEFVESETIFVDDKPYDAIVRVSFLLVHSENGLAIHFMPAVYTIPKKSLIEMGTLTEKHKSVPKAPYFIKIDESVKQLVERELRQLLPVFYERFQKGS